MASLSAMDAERGSGGRYLERFDLATLILYFPLVAENLPMLTGAISDFKPTVNIIHNPKSHAPENTFFMTCKLRAKIHIHRIRMLANGLSSRMLAKRENQIKSV